MLEQFAPEQIQDASHELRTFKASMAWAVLKDAIANKIKCAERNLRGISAKDFINTEMCACSAVENAETIRALESVENLIDQIIKKGK